MCQSINHLQRKIEEPEFVETICVSHGKAWNLRYHNERMNRTRRAFWGSDIGAFQLEDWVRPESYIECTRCRVVYGKEISKIEYLPYHMRKVNSLKLLDCDTVDYNYKLADRSVLNELFAQRGKADDVLIVRNGLLTDTTIANIALFDGVNWYTPAYPLLRGTRRQNLLEHGLIRERQILVDDVSRYKKIRLFNAMIPFGKIEFETRFLY